MFFLNFSDLKQFRKNVRFETSQLTSVFQNKADNEIEEMLLNFEQQNQQKRAIFAVCFDYLFFFEWSIKSNTDLWKCLIIYFQFVQQETAKLNDEKLMIELKDWARDQAINEISVAGGHLSDIDLFSLITRTKQSALDKVNT